MASWSTGWSVGDIVTAAEFRKGFGAVFDTTLNASAANVDITGIVATYAHLRIVVLARSDIASVTTVLGLRFNNDTAANYDSEELTGSGTTAAAAEALAGTSASVALIPGASATANLAGTAEIVIPNYAGTTFEKAVHSLNGYKTSTATGNSVIKAKSAFWRSTAAINRITLFAGGNLIAGTRVTIYAMGA